MNALIRIGITSALSACIAGCVSPAPPAVPSAMVTPQRTKMIPTDSVSETITIGKSTKADVIAALGDTLVISFDSGFEVWVYRLASGTPGKGAPKDIARSRSEKTAPDANAEFIVLFAPSGVVSKTRIRPAPRG
jgi:ABC-type Fe3+-hydroxamate transport system substrate-binding protein